jgi:2,4-dienoyl-CoA reductase-like NADH-dependent reductase (Old Yellow Enzyme family)
MLAPMTNCQSHEDGTLSDDEYRWLTLRAKGGFGLTMTCASHVQAAGKGFPGQLGIFSDQHIEGHRRLARGIRAEGSLAVVQLHHAGMRSPRALIGQDPLCPSPDAETGSRGLHLSEVEQLRDDFIRAAKRAQQAGYDGVEIHGAHGYILCQFLSATYNRRTDRYGGGLKGRTRLLFEVVEGVRQTCGTGFLLGIRLSPERCGMRLEEVVAITEQLMDSGWPDFLDISLWDCFKEPEDPGHSGSTLLSHFTGLERRGTKLTVAGKLMGGQDVDAILDQGIDFVGIGRAGILRHDFPARVIADPYYRSPTLPVTRAQLRNEGLGERFVQYMSRWDGFVSEE